MNKLENALKIISEHMHEGLFAGSKSEDLIKKAESRLGFGFPPTYREFVKTLGCGRIWQHEFYGVFDDDFDNSGIPDGVWFTLTERKDSNLPPDLMLVCSTGDGGFYALDLSQASSDGEAPVVLIEGKEWQNRYTVSSSFGDFLYDLVSDKG